MSGRCGAPAVSRTSVEKKGFEYSIRAVARVRDVGPGLRYDIVGDGPLHQQLENLIRELGVERKVFLHGSQTGEVVQRMMAEAHLFVLASVTAANGDQEGTPVSLLEAQASGLPVLSTWHSGIPEVVLHEQTGFLVAERDTKH
ncbi:MAG: glycosyltransferase [Gemmatimonadaceae bacterium]